jgi:hypothetical protein
MKILYAFPLEAGNASRGPVNRGNRSRTCPEGTKWGIYPRDASWALYREVVVRPSGKNLVAIIGGNWAYSSELFR